MVARVVGGAEAQPGAPRTRDATRRRLRQNWAMTEVRETKLPGVGVKHDFTTTDARDVGVLVHRDGRREIVVYDAVDPDSCSMQVTFSAPDARTLAELLGTSQVNTAVQAVQHEIEGLAIEWLTLDPSSPSSGRTIGDGEFRTRTGVSIVAVIRDDVPVPAPEADFVLAAGDVVVAVGPTDGLNTLRSMLGG